MESFEFYMKCLLEEVSILKCNGFLILNQVVSKSDGMASLHSPSKQQHLQHICLSLIRIKS